MEKGRIGLETPGAPTTPGKPLTSPAQTTPQRRPPYV